MAKMIISPEAAYDPKRSFTFVAVDRFCKLLLKWTIGRPMRLVSELKRRNVLRMAVLYAVAAWLIVQVVEVLIDLAKLPDWIGTTTLWLLAIGFPIALIFSWFYEITPEGVIFEKDVDPEVSITHVTGRRLDLIVISMLCAAVILFAYDKWVDSSSFGAVYCCTAIRKPER